MMMRRVVRLAWALRAFGAFAPRTRQARCCRRDERRARRQEDLDFDPFQVLSLEAAALRAMDSAARAEAVRAAYRAAALASHPDTSSTERGDRFALVKRAHDALRSDADGLIARSAAARDDALAALWRDEVREWSSAQLAAHLRAEGSPEGVVAAFLEEDVDGREVVGVPQWQGDDVDHFIWSLRWLGADDDAAVAARTEKILRDLAGRECGANFVKGEAGQTWPPPPPPGRRRR